MKIIHEIKLHNTEAIRLFSSNAVHRKNSMRIHHHAMIELSLIVKGRGIYKTNDKIYSIDEGDLFLYRPNEAHCITDIEEAGMELLNLHISPSYLYTAFPNALNSNYIKILTGNFLLRSNKLNDTLSKGELEEIRAIMGKIYKEFTEKQSDYVTVTVGYICNIFIKIARIYDDAPLLKKEQQNYQKIVSAISYINERFNEGITLEEVAAQVGYSRCYFSHIFNKCMGMSVWEYICIKRIEEALSLIKTTDKNILDIAVECGFNNTANFNKIFKKYTNLSPHSFRN